jgi:hypothetical protein
MKAKLVIGMCLFPLIACCQIYNDIILLKKDCVQYNIESEKDIFTTYSIVAYTFCNISDSIVWLWFEENANLSEERKLKEYFFREKGNFNLFHILTDANVNITNNFAPTLFYSFLKYVNPHSSFTIQLTFSKELSNKEKEQIFDYLDRHLVLVPNEKLIKYVGLPKMEQLNQFVFYKEDFIILPTFLIHF